MENLVALLPITILWIFGVGWPVAIVLRRVGFSRWWAIVAFIPLVNIVGIWVFAVVSWPKFPQAKQL